MNCLPPSQTGPQVPFWAPGPNPQEWVLARKEVMGGGVGPVLRRSQCPRIRAVV